MFYFEFLVDIVFWKFNEFINEVFDILLKEIIIVMYIEC